MGSLCVLFLVGGVVVLALYIRRVAQLRREAKENPLPSEAATIHAEIEKSAYEVQFQLRRLLKEHADPLVALVESIRRHKLQGRSEWKT